MQGVGFRATARSIAAGFDVTGWVRNEPDGSVQMEVQGVPAEIDAFLAALRGSLGRFIRDETPEPMKAVEGERGFHIQR